MLLPCNPSFFLCFFVCVIENLLVDFSEWLYHSIFVWKWKCGQGVWWAEYYFFNDYMVSMIFLAEEESDNTGVIILSCKIHDVYAVSDTIKSLQNFVTCVMTSHSWAMTLMSLWFVTDTYDYFQLLGTGGVFCLYFWRYWSFASRAPKSNLLMHPLNNKSFKAGKHLFWMAHLGYWKIGLNITLFALHRDEW